MAVVCSWLRQARCRDVVVRRDRQPGMSILLTRHVWPERVGVAVCACPCA
jgi:hypothetical protein